jgi:hypothetical protein
VRPPFFFYAGQFATGMTMKPASIGGMWSATIKTFGTTIRFFGFEPRQVG